MDPSCNPVLYQLGQGNVSKRANGAAIANFIRDNIICRFGIPKRLLSVNGTLYVNAHV